MPMEIYMKVIFKLIRKKDLVKLYTKINLLMKDNGIKIYIMVKDC
jgi:hypothetical protein